MSAPSLSGRGGLNVSLLPFVRADELLADLFEAIELLREVGLEIRGGAGKTRPGGNGQSGMVGVLGALFVLLLCCSGLNVP